MLAGAAATILVPRLFGDPDSVDPDLWRLTGYFAALCGAALAFPSLRSQVLIAFALLNLSLPYSLWLWLLGYGGAAPSLVGAPYGLARNAFAGVAWLVVSLLLALGFRMLCPRPRPVLRLFTGIGWMAVGLGLGLSLMFLVIAFLLPGPLIGREGVPLLALGGSAAIATGVAQAASAIGQEIQFRGVLLVALEREHGRWTALIAQALIFGVAHIATQYQGPAESLIPLVILLGLVWGWMTQQSRSVWPAALVHVVAELFLVAAIVSGLYGH